MPELMRNDDINMRLFENTFSVTIRIE